MNDHKPGRSGDDPTATRALTLAWVVAGGLVVTLAALFFIWQRYQFVRLGFEVSGLRRQKAALEEAIEPLEIEAEYLSRLERIEALARGRLGMRPPLPSQVKLLDAHDTAGLSSQ